MAQASIIELKLFGFVFDLDGTLVDSVDQIGRAVNSVRVARDLPRLPRSEILMGVGLPASTFFLDLDCGLELIEELVSEFRQNLTKEIKISNRVFADALLFIRELRDQHCFVAVATSKPVDLAKLVIEHSDYKNLIDYIAGVGIHEPKPDPGMILEILEVNRLEGGVMFGDRPEDVEAALKAGITAVGIAQSVFSVEDLVAAGAKFAFSDFAELRQEFWNSGESLVDYFR